MARIYTGRDARLKIKATGDSSFSVIAKAVSFQIQASLETLETTTLNEHVRSYTPGVTGYNGSCSILFYKDDNNKINTVKFLQNLFKASNDGVSTSDKVDIELSWDANKIELNAYITSGSIGASVGQLIQAEIAFIGDGQLTDTNINQGPG